MTFVVVLIFTIIPEVMNFKKSKMLYNWPKLLVVTQIVRFGSHYLEIRSDVSSFSDPSHGKKHYFASVPHSSTTLLPADDLAKWTGLASS